MSQSASVPPLIRRFREHAAERSGRQFRDYHALYTWSVDQPEEFWRIVWEFEGIESPTPLPERVVGPQPMPKTQWFEGTSVSYAAQVFRHATAAQAAGHPAIIAEDEQGPVAQIGWHELQARVAAFAISLKARGIRPGDRVVAYLPNRPEAVIAFLACASIGAIWAICAPDMGVPAVLDRFRQIEPRILIATDGVRYAGRTHDRSDLVRQLIAELPTVEAVFLVRSGHAASELTEAVDFTEASRVDTETGDAFEPEWLPFAHPLWIVYSSGTTGKPKALVHGHGGILLAAAAGRLHSDLGASYEERTPGERFHWFSSTGWMMWNMQVGGLLGGTTICIFDGSPTGSREQPDLGVLWRFAARNRVTFFGSGAQFYTSTVKAGFDFADAGDLSTLRVLGSTASPLPASVQTAVSSGVRAAGVSSPWWFNSSGGTDICGAFCTGNRELPEAPGRLQCRQLGAAVEAWDETGRPIIGEVGELVCTRPLPNMPLYLWGDPDGERYRDSYFAHYPGVWRHGDWLKIEADGSCEIFGRSDATINRGGHRMGTSEIYDAIEQLDGVADSLVVDVRVDAADSCLLLFVVPSDGDTIPAELSTRIAHAIRSSLSPRFVPDQILAVRAVPRTLSSKRQELPIKRLFEGAAVETVIDPSAMANPDCLADYIALARSFQRETA